MGRDRPVRWRLLLWLSESLLQSGQPLSQRIHPHDEEGGKPEQQQLKHGWGVGISNRLLATAAAWEGLVKAIAHLSFARGGGPQARHWLQVKAWKTWR